MNRIKITAALLLVCIAHFVFAQTAPATDLVTIKQNLKKLEVLGSVLYVAAHPDDENTRLLAYLAQEKHYRTGYLSLTRGDGGQNLLGSEQAELLGLIRTQELLAARRVDGAEQFFTRANDFGFSKGPEETLKIWDKEKVLGDVVWVIRKFRPDVIICRFPTTGEGGHGHHTSSAILAQEAFAAAADPARFPEQLRYVKPWQAKRLLWNTFNFGTTNTTSADQFKINVGVYNPVIGKGYGEMAAESRSNHKTQGFGSARQRGESFEFFKTILGDAPKNDLFDGIDASWQRVKNGGEIAAAIDTIERNFDTDHPERSVPALVRLLDKVEKVDDQYWRSQKTKELNNLIAACAGLWFEAYSLQPNYAVGDAFAITANVYTPYNVPVNIVNINGEGGFATLSGDGNGYLLPPNEVKTFLLSGNSEKMTLKKIAQPYWLAAPHIIGTYTLENDTLAGNPENPDRPKVTFEFRIYNRLIRFDRNLVYKHVDPVRGELYEPVVVAPPVTANIESADYIFRSKQPQTVKVTLRSFTKASGEIRIRPIPGWKITPGKISFTDKIKGAEWTETFNVVPAGDKPNTSIFEAVVTANNETFSLGVKTISYNHIPSITLFPPAQSKLIDLDLKIAGKNIGYINGAGDLVPDALKQVGYTIHQLSENEIMNGDLSVYDAIVTGVRAWNVNDRLAIEQPKLMDYVKNGGNLVVQYNNNNGLVAKQIGPYPFRVVNQRVTDEDAKVTILDPKSSLLNYPNIITSDDFKGWIQERGLYFVNDADPKYKTVLQMNDAGEAPNNGSLIVCDYGGGRFVYTSLAFFRQLPAGVPGAYRLFINLLSKPKNQPLN